MNKVGLFTLVGILIMAGVFYASANIEWTPKEEQLAEKEADFSEELERLGVENIDDVSVRPQENGPGTEESSNSTAVEDRDVDTTVVVTSEDESNVNTDDTNNDRASIIEDAQVTTIGNSDGTLVNTENSVTNAEGDDIPESEDNDTPQGSEVKDTFVQVKIDENRDEIDPVDLLLGSDIYNKLDTLYLLDLAEGGLTEEESGEVNAYLDSILSQNEKQKALELYSKYVHLMQ